MIRERCFDQQPVSVRVDIIDGFEQHGPVAVDLIPRGECRGKVRYQRRLAMRIQREATGLWHAQPDRGTRFCDGRDIAGLAPAQHLSHVPDFGQVVCDFEHEAAQAQQSELGRWTECREDIGDLWVHGRDHDAAHSGLTRAT